MKYIILVLLSFSVFAGEQAPSQITEETYNTYNQYTQHTEYTQGTTLAIANSQLHFDWSSDKLQAGIGLGVYDNHDAVTVGIGVRASRYLVTGSFGCVTEEKCGGGVGIITRF